MVLHYDIIVVGGGHAGCEAASAAARLGSRTLLVTMDMTKLADMSCNPAVGGVAKGQIVREIDALGGRWGGLPTLRLSSSACSTARKGRRCGVPGPSAISRVSRPNGGVRWRIPQPLSLAGHCGRTALRAAACGGGAAASARDSDTDGVEFSADCVILTAGTFLAGMMYCGRSHAEGGRAGDSASHGVTESLVAMGFEAGRMKTGTPARLDARTINFEILEPQYGDENPSKFSFSADTHPVQNQLPCFLVYTSKKVHDILRKGFGDSPLFNGTIRGSVPVIARVSRTSSTHSPIRTSTNFFSSRRVVRPTNIT